MLACFVLISGLAAAAKADVTSQGSVWRQRSGIANHNLIVRIAVNGLNNNAKVTGTGVQATFGCGFEGTLPGGYEDWRVYVQSLKVIVNGQTATLYPLDTDDIHDPKTGVAREMRLDSTIAAGSTSGTDLTITIEAKFRYELWEWVPGNPPWEEFVDVDWATYTLDVTPKVFNVGLKNATEVNATGSPGGGWASTNVPAEYRWDAVSQAMATEAGSKLAGANYAVLTGNLHTKSELILPTPPMGDPLTKLLGQSTAYFNSSHGGTSGIGDKTALVSTDSGWMTWSALGGTAGTGIISETRPLVNRFVWLYSCLCGVGSSVLGAFHIGGTNSALYGFTATVFSTLKANDASAVVDYNDASGNLVMTDKLTLHVTQLLGLLSTGTKAATALTTANSTMPPRKYKETLGGINKMEILNMSRAGDADATLYGIYRASSESDANYVQYGNWALVKRADTSIPFWGGGA